MDYGISIPLRGDSVLFLFFPILFWVEKIEKNNSDIYIYVLNSCYYFKRLLKCRDGTPSNRSLKFEQILLTW